MPGLRDVPLLDTAETRAVMVTLYASQKDTELASAQLRAHVRGRLLVSAEQAVGVRRFVAQSYCTWPCARTGGAVKTEATAPRRDGWRRY
jgi:hypothetical protein